MKVLSWITGLVPGLGRVVSSTTNHPVPGVDFRYLKNCDACGDFGIQVTRGGRHGVQHCESCGNEIPVPDFTKEQTKYFILSSWSHWMSYPLIPYNWHELSEEKKWKILGG
ncbi:MAG: hypothetical protein GF411_00910 [Candidatus Lokiarchaeota archaeon]|nr:hypothetical protein [Candidatus Lokiarchaeota archaeon]